MLALKKCSEHDVLVKTGGYFQGIYFFFGTSSSQSLLCCVPPPSQPTMCSLSPCLAAAVALKNPFVVPKSVAHLFQSTSFALQKPLDNLLSGKKGHHYSIGSRTRLIAYLHWIPLKETQLRFASVGFNSVLLACSFAMRKRFLKLRREQSLSLEQNFFSKAVAYGHGSKG